MRLRTKLMLGFGGLLSGVLLGSYLLTALLGRRAMREHTIERSEALAAVLNEVGEQALRVEKAADTLLGEQMIVQASVTAHLVDVAENEAGLSPAQINKRLMDVANTTVLDEFWVTDETGHAYLRNMEDIDFTFAREPGKRNQAWEFWHLLEERNAQFTQPAMGRELDSKVFKYAGVSGVDRPRIVQVGYNADSLAKLVAGMQARDLARAIAGAGGIERLQAVGPTARFTWTRPCPSRPTERAG